MDTLVSQYYSDIVSVPDENINLAEAALTIALTEYPQLDKARYLLRLDEMAADIQSGINIDASPAAIISGFNDYLFKEQGFSGNLGNFNDPRNSFLNDVLDEKLGIPISLSLIYIEIGKRLGLSMHGVSFPGHFLVKFIDGEDQFIIDPFSGGKVLEESDLLERLELFSTEKKSSEDLTRLLKTASNKEILERVLRNLKHIYMESDDYHHALDVTTLQLILQPEALDGLRDRAIIFDHLDCYRAASEDFQRYLQLNPQASDYMTIQSRLKELEHRINRLH